MDASVRAAEVARTSYGRLLALLASRTRDIAAAEDALSDAFAAALARWPEVGVPGNPEAWLLTAARNKLTDHQRRAARLDVTDTVPEETPEMFAESPSSFPDERLRLMLVCAHPAIDASMHAPLMMQTVLGVEATDIGRVFAVPGATMAQRLVRVKRKIKAAGIPFALPETVDMEARLGPVLNAIYAAFTVDWMDGPAGADGLRGEALYLADVLARLAPNSAEALGLASLMSASLAREPARLVDGVFVPLPDQDVTLWDEDLAQRAETYLQRAFGLGQMGRFQLEAALQSAQMVRRVTGRTDWRAVVELLTALMRMAPSLGAGCALAAALSEDADAAAGLRQLEVFSDHAAQFQPYWAVRADCLQKIGRLDEALEANARATELAPSKPIQVWLERRATTWRIALN